MIDEENQIVIINGQVFPIQYFPGGGWGICSDELYPIDDKPVRIMDVGDIDGSLADTLGDTDYQEKQLNLWKSNDLKVFSKETEDGFSVEKTPMDSTNQFFSHIIEPTYLVQELTVQVVNVALLVLLVVLTLATIVKGFDYAIIGLSKMTDNYDKVAYRHSLDTINQFVSYKRFQRSMKWWIWCNRWQYGTEINNLFSAISNSSYKEDPYYQYEVIQLFPKRKERKQLLKSKKLKQLTQKIEQLNQSYWAIDF